MMDRNSSEAAPRNSLTNQEQQKKMPPDPVWVIMHKDGISWVGDEQRTIFIFSSEELANQYISKAGVEEGTPESFSWEVFLERFPPHCPRALIDHTGKSGVYTVVSFYHIRTFYHIRRCVVSDTN